MKKVGSPGMQFGREIDPGCHQGEEVGREKRDRLAPGEYTEMIPHYYWLGK